MNSGELFTAKAAKFLGLNGGDVALPELARSGADTFASQFFRDLVDYGRCQWCEAGNGASAGRAGRSPHKPGNPVLATAFAQLAQIKPHARAPVTVTAFCKALRDQDSQLGVFFPTLTIRLAPMRRKAAFADFEGLTQSVGAILMLELTPQDRENVNSSFSSFLPGGAQTQKEQCARLRSDQHQLFEAQGAGKPR